MLVHLASHTIGIAFDRMFILISVQRDVAAPIGPIEGLTDFEAWARMRQRHGLSVEAAREVWINTIGRILPPTP